MNLKIGSRIWKNVHDFENGSWIWKLFMNSKFLKFQKSLWIWKMIHEFRKNVHEPFLKYEYFLSLNIFQNHEPFLKSEHFLNFSILSNLWTIFKIWKFEKRQNPENDTIHADFVIFVSHCPFWIWTWHFRML